MLAIIPLEEQTAQPTLCVRLSVNVDRWRFSGLMTGSESAWLSQAQTHLHIPDETLAHTKLP
jgi:hypothetical protein